MTWWVVGAVLLGVAALGLYRAIQKPPVLWGLAVVIAKAAWQALLPQINRRRAPADEKKDRKDNLAGRGDDYWRRRSGSPPKG